MGVKKTMARVRGKQGNLLFKPMGYNQGRMKPKTNGYGSMITVKSNTK